MARNKKPPLKFKSFRKVLREGLNANRQTPSDLANRTGVTASHIYAIVAGQSLPSFSLARSIGRHYRDELYFLRAFAEDYFRQNKEAKAVAKVAVETGLITKSRR